MRRLARILLILLAIGIVVAVLLWWLAPAIAVAALAPRLPMALSPRLTLVGIGTGGSATAPLLVSVRPGEVAAAAAQQGVVLPWGLVRPGQWAVVDARPLPEAAPLRVALAVVPASSPARIAGRIPAELVAQAVNQRLPAILGARPSLAFSRIQLRGAAAPGAAAGWRGTAVASGVLRLAPAGGPLRAEVELPFADAEADIAVALQPARGGAQPQVRVSLRRLGIDAGLLSRALGRTVAAVLPSAVDAAANLAIAGSLAGRSLPPWLPADPDVDLVAIAADVPAPTAPAAAPPPAGTDL